MMFQRIKAVLLAAMIGAPVAAADFSDPTWPCIQRKVVNLSAGLMWATPIPPLDGDADAAMVELADALALRRVELDSLQDQVTGYAASVAGDPDRLGQVFEQVFTPLNKRRSRIIGGIGDFSTSQIALAAKIDAARAEMSTLLSADKPDYDRIDALEEQIDWDQVIYTDRQRSIRYLCETPQLIEKRLFAIAQMLQHAAR